MTTEELAKDAECFAVELVFNEAALEDEVAFLVDVVMEIASTGMPTEDEVGNDNSELVLEVLSNEAELIEVGVDAVN